MSAEIGIRNQKENIIMKKQIGLLFLALFSGVILGEEITIAENGKAKAGIVIPAKAPGVVKLAAGELKNYLDKMTGATFVVGEKPSDGVNIYLGFGDAKDFKPDTYVIQAEGKRIDIYGKDDPAPRAELFDLFYDNPWKGTLTGVYAFLRSLGVRWFAPGKRHELVPSKPTLKIPEIFVKDTPIFADRQIADVWDFKKVFPDAGEYCDNGVDVFLWGLRNGASTRNMVMGCHSEQSLQLYKNKEWLAHPERQQLEKNGRRNPHYSCWTDPAVTELWKKAADAYFSGKSPKDIGWDLPPYLRSKWPCPFISPDEFMIDSMDTTDDNDGRCCCPRCNEFRKKYPCPDDSELRWKVIIDVAQMVKEKHPGKYISTLVYGKKKEMPKYFKVPDNIRVRICVSGPKEIDHPVRLAADLTLVKQWSGLLGKKNLPLWTYQCICFARTLPGIPDTYPRHIVEFARIIRPFTAGMYLENHNLTHTFRNLDVYIFMRTMWNPDLDIEKELDEYFTLYYGPAGGKVKELFAFLEKKWTQVWQRFVPDKPGKAGLFGNENSRKKCQEEVWSIVYSAEEMDKINRILREAEKATASDPVFKFRVGLLRKYLFDVMTAERNELMKKEDVRKNLVIPVQRVSTDSFPSSGEWKATKSYPLISAIRMISELKEAGSFQLLYSEKFLFIKMIFAEPKITLSATDKTHSSGNPDLWKDNDAELFFYAVKTRKFWQIVVNDNDAWSSQTDRKAFLNWKPMPGFHIKTVRNVDSWTIEATVPLSELKVDGGELRFNLCRERNIKGENAEYSTWSPLAMLGNWHDPDNYGTIRFEK